MTARRPAMSETELQQHVVKLLEAYGRSDVCWWSVPNGGLRNRLVAIQLKREGARRGAHDLMLLISGHLHTLELKTETSRVSVDQAVFAERIQRAGGTPHVARGLDDVIAVLTGIGAFRAGITIISAPDGSGVRTRLGAEAPAATRSPRAAGAPA